MKEKKVNIGQVFLKSMLILVLSFVFQSLLLRFTVIPTVESISAGMIFYPMLIIFITSTLYFTTAYYKPSLDLPILIAAISINFVAIIIMYS